MSISDLKFMPMNFFGTNKEKFTPKAQGTLVGVIKYPALGKGEETPPSFLPNMRDERRWYLLHLTILPLLFLGLFHKSFDEKKTRANSSLAYKSSELKTNTKKTFLLSTRRFQSEF